MTNVLFLFILILLPFILFTTSRQRAQILMSLFAFLPFTSLTFVSIRLICCYSSNRQLTPTDSSSGLCFDSLQLPHYSSLLWMAFVDHT